MPRTFWYFFIASPPLLSSVTLPSKSIFRLEIAGTATGMINIFPFAGAALGQPLMGLYLDHFGGAGDHYSVEAYSFAFKIGLIFLFGAFVASTLVKETLEKTADAHHS